MNLDDESLDNHSAFWQQTDDNASILFIKPNAQNGILITYQHITAAVTGSGLIFSEGKCLAREESQQLPGGYIDHVAAGPMAKSSSARGGQFGVFKVSMKQRQSCDAFSHLWRTMIGSHSVDIPPAFHQQLKFVKGTALDAESLGEDAEHAVGIVQPLLGAAGGGFKIRVCYFR